MLLANHKPPLVSVIAVSYNHERWVDQTLRSIVEQSLPQIELIYCDDASQDCSVQRAISWLTENNVAFQSVLHSENVGLCATLNEALRLASGKYIQIVSCDDVLLPDKLSRQSSLLEVADNQTSVVYSDAFLIDAVGSRLPEMFIQRHRPTLLTMPVGYIFGELLKGNFLPAMSTLIRKSAVVELGGFDETTRLEDYDLWLRMGRKHKFAFDLTPSVLYRLHANNLHRQLKSHIDDYWILWKHSDLEDVRLRIIELVKSWHHSEEAMQSDSLQHFLSQLDANSEMQQTIRQHFPELVPSFSRMFYAALKCSHVQAVRDKLEADFVRLKAECLRLTEECHANEESLSKMRESLSWQSTAPLRAAVDWASGLMGTKQT